MTATGYIQSVAMVRRKRLIQICVAVVLCYRTPSVTERIDAVVILLFQPNIFADFLDAAIHVAQKAITIAIAIMKREQELVIVCNKILVENRLNERLDTHLYKLHPFCCGVSWPSYIRLLRYW